jgi:hypothetical protein
VNDEKVPVSKFILSGLYFLDLPSCSLINFNMSRFTARSPVFARMFNSDFKESNEKEQVLGLEIKTDAFKELIRYIYINEVSDLDKHAFELLHAADFYQIDSLKSICEKELRSILSTTNANDIFQAAHLYSCSDELKETSFGFIKKYVSFL